MCGSLAFCETIVKLFFRKFKIMCEVCEVDEKTIEKALSYNFKDFEDDVQFYTALQSNSSIIITRNGQDFKNAIILIMTAEEYLRSIT